MPHLKTNSELLLFHSSMKIVLQIKLNKPQIAKRVKGVKGNSQVNNPLIFLINFILKPKNDYLPIIANGTKAHV